LKLQEAVSQAKAGAKVDFTACEGTQAEAQTLLKDAGMEARMESDKEKKKALLGQVDELKKKFAKVKQSLEAAQLRGDGGTGAGIGNKTAAQRLRVEVVNDRIAQQNDAILAATRSVNETEEVGREIVSELASNREKIQGARDKTAELRGATDEASAGIKRMQNRDKCVIQ